MPKLIMKEFLVRLVNERKEWYAHLEKMNKEIIIAIKENINNKNLDDIIQMLYCLFHSTKDKEFKEDLSKELDFIKDLSITIEYRVEDVEEDILEEICTYYEDDKDLIQTILAYLYHNSNNNSLNQLICNWYIENNYCLQCGTKLQMYSYYEIHTELQNNDKEWFHAELCPYCDKSEIKYIK